MSNTTDGVVWSDPNKEFPMHEAMNMGNEPHNKIANHIANMISEVLTKDYEAKLVIKNLIKNLLEVQMYTFLQEYDNVVAEDILQSFISELNVDWDNAGNQVNNGVKFATKHPDYGHARHAKLSSFARELREKIVMLKKSE